MALVFLCACSSSGASAVAGAGDGGSSGSDGGRPSITCSAIEAAATSLGDTWTPGWGPVPTALQSVPAGGTLCGTESMGDAAVADNDIVVVDSPLTGQPLLNFYEPLATAEGCKQVPVTSSGFAFSCPDGNTLIVVPDAVQAYYLVTYGD